MIELFADVAPTREKNMTTIHSWSQIQSQLRSPNNPVVFLDVDVGVTEIGRIMIELFADVAPKTAENFRQFSRAETLSTGTGRAACPSTPGQPSLTSASNSNTPSQAFCPWQTVARTRTAVSSLSRRPSANSWTGSTSCSAASSMGCSSSVRSRTHRSDRITNQKSRSRCLNVDKCELSLTALNLNDVNTVTCIS